MLLKLRSFDCLHKTRLYTLNYDLAFEYTMDKLGIEYRDGFTGFVNRTFDARTLQNKTVTSLIKMHGSVNWVTEHDTIKEFQPKFIEDENSVLFSMEEAKQKSVLIYPSSNKLYQTYASPYSELMRNLLDQLQTGKNLVIVLGYKYGDEHINDILLKSLRNPNDVFYFFYFDQQTSNDFINIVKRYSGSMPNINILEGKFLADFYNFVEYMLPDKPEKTDQEKAIEYMKKVFTNNVE